MPSHNKVINISDVDKTKIPDGSVVAIGGVHSHNVPMSIIRQIIRNKVRDLTLIGSISAGLPIDMLVGAETTKKVLAPYIGFEMWGLAPRFRKAVESGQVESPDVCEAFPVYSLRAAANGLTFHPFPPGIHTTSSIPDQTDLYKKVTDPFSGKEVYAIEAIHPDVGIIHVQKASKEGNCIHEGSVVTDRLMAAAAKTVIVSCDELIADSKIREDPSRVTIPSFYVDYVIPLKYAAHPTSSHSLYPYDAEDIKMYLQAAKDDSIYKDFIKKRISIDEQTYLDTFVKKELIESPTKPVTAAGYTVEELIACVFSRDINDHELGICGAVSQIPMAAMQLAERLYAPAVKWIAGGSGYVNPRGTLVPSSTDFHMSIGAETKLSMNEVIPIEMEDIDFFFAGGIQIDAKGNTNLAGFQSDTGWKFRGPGSVGLPFLARAGRVYLYTLTHNTRTLVEKVSYISGPGHQDELKNYGGGPSMLVTNLCVFRWQDDQWNLQSIHPNMTLEEVKEHTGFDFVINGDIPTTKAPTDEELDLLRKIDPIGYLRGAMD